jgi:hypothetical protein
MDVKRIPEVGEILWPNDLGIRVTKIEGGIVYGHSERGVYEIPVAGLMALNPPIPIGPATQSSE